MELSSPPTFIFLQTTFPILFNKIAFQFNASLPLDDHKLWKHTQSTDDF